jgi:hypothetical protein
MSAIKEVRHDEPQRISRVCVSPNRGDFWLPRRWTIM